MDTINQGNGKTATPDITMWLEGYEDLFSDFDGRKLTDRNISEDFIDQLRRNYHENDFTLSQLHLLVPSSKRDQDKEKIISNRLHTFFKKNHQHFLKQRRTAKRKGLILSLIGISTMLGASYVSSLKSDTFINRLIFVVLEPAGWFLVWTGFEHLLYSGKEQKSALDFYATISKCKIRFDNK